MIASLLLLWGLGLLTLMASPSKDPDMDLTEEIMQLILGPKNEGIRGQIHGDALARGNTPASRPRRFADEEALEVGDTLWIVDRILEPQTIVHFFEFAHSGQLPSGKLTELPLLGDDIMLLTEPYSEWAPAPFEKLPRPAVDDVMARIGSSEDSGRLQVVSKDLHAMKSRLWEGIMPLSQRRLEEKRVSDLRNFTYTSQLVTQVINVFHYLNEPDVRDGLRGTYNLIYDHLETFETALNAKRAQDSQPSAASVTALWAEFMRSHYEVMENRAHSWVLNVLRPLKKKVLAALRSHQPDQIMEADYDEIQWKLTNMWQDLAENTAHADWGIFIPMDGYKGRTSPSATPRSITSETSPIDGTQPIAFSPDTDRRMREYHLRRRHIDLMASIKDIAQSGPAKGPFNDPARFGPSMTMQAKAQAGARKELRGNPITYQTESWMEYVIRNSGWGYVVYKTSQAHSDTQWTRFTKRFEADTGNWGHGLDNISNIQDQSKMHWIDGNDVGNANPSLQDLKRHFITYTESAAFPENCFSDMFLVADDASVASYLTRAPQVSIPGGDVGPFIKAVDALFDPKDPAFRSDESPGFDGTLRVLGSLVWDDMGAQLLTQTQGLAELWPLAMEHPLEVYVGPVVEAQTEAWRNLGKMDRQVLRKWIKGVRDEDEKITRDEL